MIEVFPTELNKYASYLMGYLQTDGHNSVQTRNRGKVIAYYSQKDNEFTPILGKCFFNIDPDIGISIIRRDRITNFGENKSIEIRVYNREFREWITKCGLPIGKKNEIIKKPTVPFERKHYLRGLYDGDGSIGFTATGLHFISITLSSDNLAEYVKDCIYDIAGYRPKTNRNKRDNVYNIMLGASNALSFIEYLYDGEKELSLPRKYNMAMKILEKQKENK